ncbi:MAG: ATP-binding cassette domain-containing protein [Gemmataceae bacterium]|nr:ATP-binding cassette domain-containing protein [Gemmataceae bacterium]
MNDRAAGPSGRPDRYGLLQAVHLGKVFPDGQVVFEGKPLSAYRNLDEYRTQKIGFVFQSFLLLPTLTALENVQVPMFESSLAARARAEIAVRLLDAVGLSHRVHHLPSRLSVGERQRVAIARHLRMTRPCCWPTSRPAISIRAPPWTSSTCSRSFMKSAS